MIVHAWNGGGRKTIVCLDSYHNGIPKGRIYTPLREVRSFDSLSQFLIKMQDLMDEQQMPQSYTVTRTFCETDDRPDRRMPSFRIQNGMLATFEVHIFYRQHSSWQGVIVWLDRKQEQRFRSVLELIVLMDSALQSVKGCDSA